MPQLLSGINGGHVAMNLHAYIKHIGNQALHGMDGREARWHPGWTALLIWAWLHVEDVLHSLDSPVRFWLSDRRISEQDAMASRERKQTAGCAWEAAVKIGRMSISSKSIDAL